MTEPLTVRPSPMWTPKIKPVAVMCENCPFHPNGKGLAVDHEDFPAIVQSVSYGMDFVCHKTGIFDERTTTRIDDDGQVLIHPRHQPHFRQCRGAMLVKQGHLPCPQPAAKKPKPKKRKRT